MLILCPQTPQTITLLTFGTVNMPNVTTVKVNEMLPHWLCHESNQTTTNFLTWKASMFNYLFYMKNVSRYTIQMLLLTSG